jgi:hypothetical protein
VCLRIDLAAQCSFIPVHDLALPSNDRSLVELPIAAAVDERGRVAVLDRSGFVFLWDETGSHPVRFGGQGEGPGLFRFPSRLSFGPDGSLWVWDAVGRFSVFRGQDHVRFVYLQGARLRDFLPINAAKLLIATKETGYDRHGRRSGSSRAKIEVLDTDNNLRHQIHQYPWSELVGVARRGFAPEIDIQVGPAGRIFFGFSGTETIYRLDEQVRIHAHLDLELPKALPDEQDIERAREIVFHRRTRQISFADVFDFSQPKAHYTHLSIEENRISLILTPIGSLDKLYAHGWATSSGSYQHLDRATGALLERGSYSFPEGSRIFFETGRVLICELSSDDDYRFRLARFRGPE